MENKNMALDSFSPMDLVLSFAIWDLLWDSQMQNEEERMYLTRLLRKLQMLSVKFSSHIQGYTVAIYYVNIQLLFTGALLTNLLQGPVLNKYLVNSNLCL